MSWYIADFKVHVTYCRIFLHLRFHSSRAGVGQRFCVFNKLLVDTAVAGLGNQLRRARTWYLSGS